MQHKARGGAAVSSAGGSSHGRARRPKVRHRATDQIELRDAILSVEQTLAATPDLLDAVWIPPCSLSAGIEADESRLNHVLGCGIASNDALEKARRVAHDLGNHLSAAHLVLSRLRASEPMTAAETSLSDAVLSVELALAANRGLLEFLWDGADAKVPVA
ncbi:MAG TPA: hypothetical protein VJR47_20735 [Stellaceae bacterium]|nr:hypothetical protein [Stellaceae bacterium]